VVLTGLGATDADWLSHHRADTAKNAGCCYDPQAGGTDLYAAASHSKGRIAGYTIQPAPPMPALAVVSLVKSNWPPDVQVDWDQTVAGCRQMQLRSKQLDAVLGAGETRFIELVSSGDAYDPERISQVLMVNLPPTSATDAGAC